MAQRVIQFPVRNAFTAERSQAALAREAEFRDTQEQTRRITEQVEGEIARKVERQAIGRNTEFDAARNRAVITMRPTSRLARLRKNLASKARSFTSKTFKPR